MKLKVSQATECYESYLRVNTGFHTSLCLISNTSHCQQNGRKDTASRNIPPIWKFIPHVEKQIAVGWRKYENGFITEK